MAAALNNFCLLSVRALARYSLSRVLELAASLDRCGYLDTRVDNIYNIYTALSTISTLLSPDIEHGTTSAGMESYSGEDIRYLDISTISRYIYNI